MKRTALIALAIVAATPLWLVAGNIHAMTGIGNVLTINGLPAFNLADILSLISAALT